MGLQSLRLANFRLFETRELRFDDDAVTVFLSPNGTGKTSILEAVFTLATGSSFRTPASGDLLRTGSTEASVWGLAYNGPRRIELQLALKKGERSVTKRLTVNEQRPKTYGEVYEVFPVTVFTPEGVDMVRREPSGRRDFLTRLAINLDPRFADAVERFERVLKQRNALLRALRGELPSPSQRDELAVWDEEFVTTGLVVLEGRERVLEPLAPVVSHYYGALADGRGDVGLRYEPSWEGELRAALRSAERDDRHRGHSTVGPHRDDLNITLDGRDTRRQASQGEQRSTALAMLLAGDHLVRERRNVSPLLMLDDVFSELDDARSARLLQLLPKGQTLVTTASPLPHGLESADRCDLTKDAT